MDTAMIVEECPYMDTAIIVEECPYMGTAIRNVPIWTPL